MSLPKKSTNGALDELIESEERLRSVIKSAIDSVILVDNDGKIISWNNSAEKNFLYTEEEVLGKPLTIIIPDGYINFRQEDTEFSNKHGEGTIFTFTLSLREKE